MRNLALLAAMVFLVDEMAVSAKAQWVVTQITDNTVYDGPPQISGSNVVWPQLVDGKSKKMFLYDGSTVTQISDIGGRRVQISGTNVVWEGVGSDGSSDNEIFFYDGSTVTQLTDNIGDDNAPQISGSNVVWYGQEFNPNPVGNEEYITQDIFFYDGATVTQITNDNLFERYLQIDGTNAVWVVEDQIFFYDGSTVTQISDITGSYVTGTHVQISGTNVAWRSYDGYDREIFLATRNSDFDLDGNVDGVDLLKWQRGESYDPHSLLDLTAWRTDYGTSSSLLWATGVVPEPTSILLMLSTIVIRLITPYRRYGPGGLR